MQLASVVCIAAKPQAGQGRKIEALKLKGLKLINDEYSSTQ